MHIASTALSPLHMTQGASRKPSQSQKHMGSVSVWQGSHSCMVLLLAVSWALTSCAALVITEMHKPPGRRETFLKATHPVQSVESQKMSSKAYGLKLLRESSQCF